MNEETVEEIEGALEWFGIDAKPEDCDICENGQVYYGLTQILPKGSICYSENT